MNNGNIENILILLNDLLVKRDNNEKLFKKDHESDDLLREAGFRNHYAAW